MVELGDFMKKLSSILLFFSLILLLCNGTQAIRYSEQALTIWFESLIPSMFVCMVLIRTLYKQQLIARLCPHWLCHLFHLQSSEMALFISTLLLGFPNGSMLIDEAYAAKQITKASAKRLFLICCFPTPGFVILTCGIHIFHQASIGFLLYFVQVVYGLICLLCYHPRQGERRIDLPAPKTTWMNDLRTSIVESGVALFMMGGYLMVFMTLSALFLHFIPLSAALPLRIVSEFSSGVFLIQSTTLSLSTCLYLTCALLGFGGFCVHMQIYAMCEHHHASYLSFLAMRCIQAIVTLLFFCLLYQLLV